MLSDYTIWRIRNVIRPYHDAIAIGLAVYGGLAIVTVLALVLGLL